MRLRDKILIVLLALLLLVVIPPHEIVATWNYFANSNFAQTYYPVFESYRFLIVTLFLVLVLALFMAKKVIGSHRAFYSLFGILLILLSYFYFNPFNSIESQVVTVFFVGAMEIVFMTIVHNTQERLKYATLIIPAIGLLFVSSMFYIVFFGFFVYVGSLLLQRKTSSLAIRDVNGVSSTPKTTAQKKPTVTNPAPTTRTVPTSVQQPVKSVPTPAPVTPPSLPQNVSKPAKPKLSRQDRNTVQVPVASTKVAPPPQKTPAPQVASTPLSSPAPTGIQSQGGNGGQVSAAEKQPLKIQQPRQTVTETEILGSFPTNVSWPAQSDYSRAMQNLTFSVSPRYTEVRDAKVSPNPFVKLSGNIVYSSGNYGTIFKLVNNGYAHALKCFTRSKPDLNRRYLGISKALHSTRGDNLAFVDFQYLPNAVRTFKNPSIFFPALRMLWIEGTNLNQFITDHIKYRKDLMKLADDFLSEMEKIRKVGIAHGDISGDNIMVGQKGKITLVDYDGMFVPEFAGMKAAEIGHDHFQHPARDAATYSERLDNFSILITYLSILAVAEKPDLWEKYNGGDQDCLIFRKKDFQNPKISPVIADLLKIRGRVRSLAELLLEALSHGPLWPGTDPSKIAKIKK